METVENVPMWNRNLAGTSIKITEFLFIFILGVIVGILITATTVC